MRTFPFTIYQFVESHIVFINMCKKLGMGDVTNLLNKEVILCFFVLFCYFLLFFLLLNSVILQILH